MQRWVKGDKNRGPPARKVRLTVSLLCAVLQKEQAGAQTAMSKFQANASTS